MAEQGRTGLQTLVDGFTDGGANTAASFRTLGTDLNDSALNLTDDIATGSWTPVLSDQGNMGTYTIGTVQYAQYIRIRDLVHVWGDLRSITHSGAPSGTLILSGLPFNSVSGGNYPVLIGFYENSLGSNFHSIKAELLSGTANIHFLIQDTLDDGYSTLTAQQFSGDFTLSVMYTRA